MDLLPVWKKARRLVRLILLLAGLLLLARPFALLVGCFSTSLLFHLLPTLLVGL